jgi:hypothetical protein
MNQHAHRNSFSVPPNGHHFIRSTVISLTEEKVKVKLFPYLTKHQAMKKYWESGGIAPRILKLGIIWETSGKLHARPALSPGPLHRRMGGAQSRYGRDGEEIEVPLLPLPEIEARSSSR